MSEFELIDRADVPAPRAGLSSQFTDALEAALANPGNAVKLAGLSQRQRSRLQQLTSTTATHNKSDYAGRVKMTAVRHLDGSYDVYLTAEQVTAPAVRFPIAEQVQ